MIAERMSVLCGSTGHISSLSLQLKTVSLSQRALDSVIVSTTAPLKYQIKAFEVLTPTLAIGSQQHH